MIVQISVPVPESAILIVTAGISASTGSVSGVFGDICKSSVAHATVVKMENANQISCAGIAHA